MSSNDATSKSELVDGSWMIRLTPPQRKMSNSTPAPENRACSLSTLTDGSITRIPHKKGLSIWLASAFILGEMAGSGVLALPRAIADAGWIGVVVLAVCCFTSLYAGICLGRCWIILEERWSEYKEAVRYPYPAIAYRASGQKMKHLVSASVNITLIGVATVFLLLASQLIGSLASSFGVSFCYWILILAVILCPLMWLGTPDDFWPAAVAALGTTLLACVLILVAFVQYKDMSFTAKYPSPSFESFFLAFGTILFAFGGAATFPTFQNDMRDRDQFPKAATIAFVGLFMMYAPISVMGYSVFGDYLKDNVVASFNPSPLRSTIEVLLAFHLFSAFLLVINPPSQNLEEYFNIPKHFGWKRCLLRSSILVIVIFVALTIPRFGKVLNLVGGSTITLLTFVLPPYFYMKLCSQSGPSWPERRIPLHEKVFLIEIMVVGVIGGCISTYSAVLDIAKPSAFNPPCYVNITAAGMQ